MKTYECSWPGCGCDPEGVESPVCRAEHETELEGRNLDWEVFIRECCHQLGVRDGDHMNEAIWMSVRDAKRYRWLRTNGRRAIYTGDKECPLAQGELLDKAVDERRRFDEAAILSAPVEKCQKCGKLIPLDCDCQ